MRRLLGLGLCVLSLLGEGGLSAEAADTSLARRVADQLGKALPAYDFTVVDSLTIKVSTRSGASPNSMQVNLDRVVDYCTRVPDDCPRMVSDFVVQTSGMVKSAMEPMAPTVAALRAVVRPAGYASQMKDELAGKEELVTTAFAGDLAVLCYVDTPTAMRPAFKRELSPMKLSVPEALATCTANTRRDLPALPTRMPNGLEQGKGSIGYLSGNPYGSSYLILHDDWKPLAESVGGHLLVAAPDADKVIYAPDTGPASVDALFTLAKQLYGEAERPISATVFRWTANGWKVAAP